MANPPKSPKQPAKRSSPTQKFFQNLKVVDNLREGDTIVGIEADFVRLFRKEIQERLFKKPEDKRGK